VETEAVTSTDLRGSDMVNIAVPLRNVTSTSTTSTSTSTTTPDSDDIGFVEMSQRYVGSAQKQIFEFMSGVYNMVSDNPMESTVSVLLLLGMFYVYYSRVRSSGLGKETDNVKDEVDGKKK
jgi:hypothetical protein